MKTARGGTAEIGVQGRSPPLDRHHSQRPPSPPVIAVRMETLCTWVLERVAEVVGSCGPCPDRLPTSESASAPPAQAPESPPREPLPRIVASARPRLPVRADVVVPQHVVAIERDLPPAAHLATARADVLAASPSRKIMEAPSPEGSRRTRSPSAPDSASRPPLRSMRQKSTTSTVRSRRCRPGRSGSGARPRSPDPPPRPGRSWPSTSR